LKAACRICSGAIVAMVAAAAFAACPPDGTTKGSLLASTRAAWRVADDASRNSLALSLLDCLADHPPVLRDELEQRARPPHIDTCSMRMERDVDEERRARRQAQVAPADERGHRRELHPAILAVGNKTRALPVPPGRERIARDRRR